MYHLPADLRWRKQGFYRLENSNTRQAVLSRNSIRNALSPSWHLTHGEATAESQGSAPYPSRSLITFSGFHRRNFFLRLDYFGLSISLAVGGIAIKHRFSVGQHRTKQVFITTVMWTQSIRMCWIKFLARHYRCSTHFSKFKSVAENISISLTPESTWTWYQAYSHHIFCLLSNISLFSRINM